MDYDTGVGGFPLSSGKVWGLAFIPIMLAAIVTFLAVSRHASGGVPFGSPWLVRVLPLISPAAVNGVSFCNEMGQVTMVAIPWLWRLATWGALAFGLAMIGWITKDRLQAWWAMVPVAIYLAVPVVILAGLMTTVDPFAMYKTTSDEVKWTQSTAEQREAQFEQMDQDLTRMLVGSREDAPKPYIHLRWGVMLGWTLLMILVAAYLGFLLSYGMVAPQYIELYCPHCGGRLASAGVEGHYRCVNRHCRASVNERDLYAESQVRCSNCAKPLERLRQSGFMPEYCMHCGARQQPRKVEDDRFATNVGI